MTTKTNPLGPFLEQQGCFILDGGLASELEARGHDLNDPLWSARLLIEEPEAIQAVHETYLAAGADCIITASYQATVPGFLARGQDLAGARALLRRSVELGMAARDAYWGDGNGHTGRLRPLVAASIGPYGAFLADGSEYDGRYGLSRAELREFHAERWLLLAASDADLLACETIPSFLELQALTDLLAGGQKWAWFSFSCADERHLHDGTPILDCVEWLAAYERVAAVGINCTAPHLIPELVRRVSEATDRPVIVYPNSGEQYDPATKRWYGTAEPADFAQASCQWRDLGASVIGGCCRTGPDHIRLIRESLL